MPVTTGVTSPPTELTHANIGHHLNLPQHSKSLYRLRAGVILSRPPILTRKPSAFENAFYLYQKRLNERMSTPFARSFYFRKDQPAGIDWAIKFGDRRHVMAREIGRLTRTGRDAWDDEALVDDGEELASPEYIRERLYTEAESRVSEDGEALSFEDRLKIERPMSRKTEADRTGDVKRLDRALDRTLYLVVRDSMGRWRFPSDEVRPDEGLHEVNYCSVLWMTYGNIMANFVTDRCPRPSRHCRRKYEHLDGGPPPHRLLEARADVQGRRRCRGGQVAQSSWLQGLLPQG